MRHKELLELSVKWLKNHKKDNIIVPNCKIIFKELKCASNFGEIPDVIGFNSFTSVLLEIKTSKSDFIKDIKEKSFRTIHPEKGMGELRLFVCEKGLIDIEEVPDNWGLLYYYKELKRFDIVKRPIYQSSNLKAEKAILISYIRRNI